MHFLFMPIIISTLVSLIFSPIWVCRQCVWDLAYSIGSYVFSNGSDPKSEVWNFIILIDTWAPWNAETTFLSHDCWCYFLYLKLFKDWYVITPLQIITTNQCNSKMLNFVRFIGTDHLLKPSTENMHWLNCVVDRKKRLNRQIPPNFPLAFTILWLLQTKTVNLKGFLISHVSICRGP